VSALAEVVRSGTANNCPIVGENDVFKFLCEFQSMFMNLERKYANIVYSFITVVCWTAVVLFFAYPDEDSAPTEPGLRLYLIYTLFFALGFGAILLVLRFLKMFNDKQNFFYVLAGVLNVCVGLFGIILYIFGVIDRLLELFIFSLLMGGFILAEVVRDKEEDTSDVNEA
jgi:hypothetical protein